MNESEKLHRFSDVDSSWRAQHHTLGTGKNQASPGDHIHDGVTSKALAGSWTDYDCSFRNAFAGFAIGNGTIVSKYMEANGLVYLFIDVVMGSTTTYGTGGFFFTVPTDLPMESPTYNAFSAAMYDRASFLDKLIGAVGYTSTNVALITESGAITPTSPVTVQNFTRFNIKGWYIPDAS